MGNPQKSPKNQENWVQEGRRHGIRLSIMLGISMVKGSLPCTSVLQAFRLGGIMNRIKSLGMDIFRDFLYSWQKKGNWDGRMENLSDQ